MDDVIPLTMKIGARDMERGHLLLRDLDACGISGSVETAGDFQSLGSGGVCDKRDNGFVVTQGFTPPVGGNEREQAMFNLVPFAGAWGKMTNRDVQTGFISQFLKFQLPQSQAVAIAAA